MSICVFFSSNPSKPSSAMTSSLSIFELPNFLEPTSHKKSLRQSTPLALRNYPHLHLRRLKSTLFTDNPCDHQRHNHKKPKHTRGRKFSEPTAPEFEPASPADFHLAQKRWAKSAETQKLIRSSDDHVNFIAMKSIINGCANKIYFNSFLCGPCSEDGEGRNDKQLHVALDSEMQRFARFKLYTVPDGTQYLMWLGFAKRATRIEHTYVYTAHESVLKVPPDIYKVAPLLAKKFSVADMASIVKQ